MENMIYRFLILTLTLLILMQSVLKASANNMVSTIFKDTSLNISEVSHGNITIDLLLFDSHSSEDLTFPKILSNYYFTPNYIGSVFPVGTKSKYQKATVEYEKGNVASSQQKWTEALEYYEKAVKIYPGFIFARVNIPLIHYQCGDELEAIKEGVMAKIHETLTPRMDATLGEEVLHFEVMPLGLLYTSFKRK